MKFIVKLGYGVGHVTNDLCSAIWFTYVLIFYELVLGFTTIYAGLIMLVGQAADAVATPAIGILCDRGPACWKIDLRKRKLWYLSGSIIVLLTFPFLYFECWFLEKYPMVVKFSYYVIFVIIFQVAWACVQIAHLAIAPDLTPKENERTVLMSIRNTFTVLSNLFVYTQTFLLFKLQPSVNNKSEKLSPMDIGKFQIVVITALSVGTLCTIFFYIFVKENLERLVSDNEKMRNRLTYRQLFCRISLYQISMIYMCSRLFSNVTQTLLPLYLNVTLLLDKPTIASIPFVMYLSSFIASILSAPLNDFIGRKLTYLIGSLLAFGAAAWIILDTSNLYKQYFIYVVTVFIGFASSLLLVTALTVTTDHIGDDINNSAFLYGILSFMDKLSCGVIIMIIQVLQAYSGPMYYRDALAYICCCSAGVGLFCILTVKRVRKKEEEEEDDRDIKIARKLRKSSVDVAARARHSIVY